jgi:hypothetical protein
MARHVSTCPTDEQLIHHTQDIIAAAISACKHILSMGQIVISSTGPKNERTEVYELEVQCSESTVKPL